MRLELWHDGSDGGIQEQIRSFELRRYVARSMVPEGYERYFQDKARFSSAHTSTAIEGNPTGEQQAMLVMVRGANLAEPDEVEMANAELAYQLLEQLASDRSLRIDQGLIRTFNSILLQNLQGRGAELRGKYRPGGSQVVDAVTREVRYNPPPPEWVPELMGNMEKDIERWRQEDPPPVVAAKVHFALASIHPFVDGNGRTARLLADLVLQQSNWSVDGMLSASPVLLDTRQEYYDALRRTQGLDFVERVDVTPFVKFHTSTLARAVARLEDAVVHFNIRRDEALASSRNLLNPRQILGLLYMDDLGALSTSIYARLTRCSPATALADLREMAIWRIVVKEGAGKSTRYALNPDLRRR